ncbi:MAG: hypothetical protein ACPH4G_01490 [Henriciella sp.]
MVRITFLAALSAGVMLGNIGSLSHATEPVSVAAETEQAAKSLLFVTTANGMKLDPEAGTVTLIEPANNIVWFTDRPGRDAGHMHLEEYMSLWVGRQNDFGDVPPNAVLIAEGHELNPAVLELLSPQHDRGTLTYDVKIIEGDPPLSAGAVTLVIDPFLGTICPPGPSDFPWC